MKEIVSMNYELTHILSKEAVLHLQSNVDLVSLHPYKYITKKTHKTISMDFTVYD